jgi:hypothetical protein
MTATANELLEERKAIEHLLKVWFMDSWIVKDNHRFCICPIDLLIIFWIALFDACK